jgi:hypothetical protein
MPLSTLNAVFRAEPSRRIKVNPKALLAGGFALEKERLDVHAALTYFRSLKAHLVRTIDQQSAESQLIFVFYLRACL